MNVSFSVRFQKTVTLIMTVAIISLLVFYGYLPKRYNLAVGSVSNSDIYATRNFVDTYQTEREANIAKNSIKPIFVRSEELSKKSIDNVSLFFVNTKQARTRLVSDYGTVLSDFSEIREELKTDLYDGIGIVPGDDDIDLFFSMSTSAFNYLQFRANTIAELIMQENVNTDTLNAMIDEKINQMLLEETSYSNYADLLSKTLKLYMNYNSVYDVDATTEAQENAYSAAKNDPVTVEKGTKIISKDDTVTEHVYSQLVDLELIRDDAFDVVLFVRALIYVLLIALVTLIYVFAINSGELSALKVFYMITITYMLPIAATLYQVKISSGIMILVLFFTTIASTYIGISAAVILSISNMLLVWPLYGFDHEYAFIAIVGILVCASIAGRKNHRYNSASLIIVPMILCTAASLCYNFLNAATRNEFIDDAVWVAISSLLSIVAAIGLMPIYELFSNTVSPVKLIELSQPGHPLLKKLFFEASGTYQHSMMVANLADAAAEAVGADALLCKVAAYYHDVGKLENPLCFTENQTEGYNPHDHLTVEESVAIITAHTVDGIKIAKKYKLPQPIIKVIDEHHGTTYPSYFYIKAQNYAKEHDLPDPDVDSFRHKGHIPSTRESAIVMLADTTEAAVKSMKTTDLDEVEAMIRKLIKSKIDQDQLKESGLSFADIENITVAFRQVYAGVYHERIKYPDENNNNK